MKTKIIIALVIVGLGVLLGWRFIFPSTPSATAAVMQPAPVIINPATLPGIQASDAPWSVEIAHLRERLSAIGLAALAAEGAALHTHQHLDIMIDGVQIAIPSGIGINQAAGFISPVHIHDATGVIHVESPIVRDFTLGELFDVWGVLFTKDCIGSSCADDTHKLLVYVNGEPFTGADPRELILESHQEIAIIYGSASTTPLTVPSVYSFPAGE